MIQNSRNYIIVTACKNEAKNLPNIIESVVAQTIQPILWVIMDDGSTDETPIIINDASKKYNWIKVLHLDEGRRDLGIHYSKVVKTGFDYAIDFCINKGLEYKYLGNLDGDLILVNDFYEKLIKEFENNPYLGVASGGTKHVIGNRMKHAKLSIDEPSGGHMLLRRECFEECKGIPITYSIDSVLKAKAKLRRWRTQRIEAAIATEIRDVGNAEGYWRGKIVNGKSAYYLNLHPIHIIVKSIKYSFRKPYYIGIAFLYGYFSSLIKRNRQTDDLEVRKFFWNKWRKKINL